MNIECPSIKRL